MTTAPSTLTTARSRSGSSRRQRHHVVSVRLPVSVVEILDRLTADGSLPAALRTAALGSIRNPMDPFPDLDPWGELGRGLEDIRGVGYALRANPSDSKLYLDLRLCAFGCVSFARKCLALAPVTSAAAKRNRTTLSVRLSETEFVLLFWDGSPARALRAAAYRLAGVQEAPASALIVVCEGLRMVGWIANLLKLAEAAGAPKMEIGSTKWAVEKLATELKGLRDKFVRRRGRQ